MYMTAKRLKPYFQAHPITVVSSALLVEIIGSRDALGRVAKWAIEIASHGIKYEPRTSIKSQALADFLVDWAETQYEPPLPGLQFLANALRWLQDEEWTRGWHYSHFPEG